MIRVLFAVESSAVCNRLRDLIGQDPDVEVVGEVADPIDLLVAVNRTQADVAIVKWPQSGELPGICSHLLTEYPDLLVIGIPLREDRAYACRQRIARTRLPTMEGVVSEIHRRVPAVR